MPLPENIIILFYWTAPFDVIGMDPITDANLTRHKKLFCDHDIINIENLCNLDQCGSDLFWFFALPLKWKDARRRAAARRRILGRFISAQKKKTENHSQDFFRSVSAHCHISLSMPVYRF